MPKLSLNNDQLLANYISLAEARFGPRCVGWEIAPVEIDRDTFAEAICDAATKRITVHITNSTSI